MRNCCPKCGETMANQVVTYEDGVAVHRRCTEAWKNDEQPSKPESDG